MVPAKYFCEPLPHPHAGTCTSTSESEEASNRVVMGAVRTKSPWPAILFRIAFRQLSELKMIAAQNQLKASVVHCTVSKNSSAKSYYIYLSFLALNALVLSTIC